MPQLQQSLLLDFLKAVALNVPFENRVVISETHLPIMHNIVVDDINLILIGMHVEGLDVVVHQDGTLFMDFVFDVQFVFVPYILVFFKSSDIFGLFG